MILRKTSSRVDCEIPHSRTPSGRKKKRKGKEREREVRTEKGTREVRTKKKRIKKRKRESRKRESRKREGRNESRNERKEEKPTNLLLLKILDNLSDILHRVSGDLKDQCSSRIILQDGSGDPSMHHFLDSSLFGLFGDQGNAVACAEFTLQAD
jgi:hypothetical protein